WAVRSSTAALSKPADTAPRLWTRPSKNRLWAISSWRSLCSVDDCGSECDGDGMRAGVRLELREDMAHVALHRLLADEELGRDVGVRHAVCQQLQDLPLAGGQHVLALLGQERGHQRRVDVPIALSHLLDRPHDGLVRSLLEDVALGAGLESARQQAA